MERARHFAAARTISFGVAAVTVFAATGHAQTAAEILKRTRDVYAAMRSYSDAGLVLYYPDAASSNPILSKSARQAFTTYFSRTPRRFLLDFRKNESNRFVVWGDPDAFHTWDRFTGVRNDYPNPNNSGAMSGSVAITKIPTLLYSKAQLLSDFSYYDDMELDGTEPIEGHRCYRLVGRAHDEYAASGKAVNVRKMTLWIDSESSLVRQMSQDWGPVIGGREHKVEMIKYQPQANPTLDETKFTFTPPPR